MNALRALGVLVLVLTACDAAGPAADSTKDGASETAAVDTAAIDTAARDGTEAMAAALTVEPPDDASATTPVGRWVTVANTQHPLVPQAHQLPDGSVEMPKVYVSNLQVMWTPATGRM